MATDFLRQEIVEGDKVIFVQLGYRNLLLGTVERITPKTLLITHEKTNVGTTKTKQFHKQVVKVFTGGDANG